MFERHFITDARKSFRCATRLYEGRGARHDLIAQLPEGPRVLVADRRFADNDFARALAPAVAITVTGEPRRRTVAPLVLTVRSLEPAAVIALGGGSTIDTAKAIHAALCFAGDMPRDAERPAHAPALIALPTTAGSGSETSRFFILADDAGVKCAHRAWSFAPDAAILDPALIADSGAERLVLGAFDSFLHLWETLVCRHERSAAADMLALEGITAIADAMTRLGRGEALDDAARLALQRASAYGGLAISNVRTGLIHTLAESLAAQVPLNHPETLYVFFADVLAHYERAVANTVTRLDRRLAAELGREASFAALVALWHRLFADLGIAARIEAALSAARPDPARLLLTAQRDTVLAKENPAPLTPGILETLIRRRIDAGARPLRAAGGA